MENTNATQYRSLDNLAQLGLAADAPKLRILWMYPGSLSIHGGRGDVMALLRFATQAKLPVQICRVERLTDEVPLEEADMLWFCCGDMDCVPDIVKALQPCREALAQFAARGKMILANGSTGAILARELELTDGTVVPGLGLLGMRWQRRKSVHGDDLWLHTADGLEVIGNEIKLAEITLDADQAPFATVRYGRGNCGDGREGAETGNVIYTGCLGPVLVRNPALAMVLLRRAAQAAGLPAEPERFVPDPAAIVHELAGLEEAKKFILRKMEKK